MNAVRLPPPASDGATKLPHEISAGIDLAILDRWVDAPTWAHRQRIANSFMTAWAMTPRGPDRLRARTASSVGILTHLLENLGETTLHHPAQAALYRTSLHAPWRMAAAEWFRLNDDVLEHVMRSWPAWTVLAIDFLSVFGIDGVGA